MEREEMDPEQFYVSMKYLSNEKTRQIIRMLYDEPLTLSELESRMTDVSKPTLSRLLKEMENNKVIDSSEIKESRPGRQRKKYFPNIRLPKLSREELRDFLERGFVIHLESPLFVAMQPSSVAAHFRMTKGLDVVAYFMKTSLMRRQASSQIPTDNSTP